MEDQNQLPVEQPAPAGVSLTLSDIVQPLYRTKGWMRLIGVMMIIGGVLQCLSCIGLIYGWLPIWMGILLLNAATAIEQAHDLQDAGQIVVAQQKLALYLKIMGVLMLLGIVMSLVALLLMFIAPAILQPLIERFSDFQIPR